MSIVRVGLAETRNYGEGWSAIFGSAGAKKKAAKPAKVAARKKSKTKKKK